MLETLSQSLYSDVSYNLWKTLKVICLLVESQKYSHVSILHVRGEVVGTLITPDIRTIFSVGKPTSLQPNDHNNTEQSL